MFYEPPVVVDLGSVRD
ncbi:lasso RiPP family leader peptide-containing protein, partial [Streptomyces niveus]